VREVDRYRGRILPWPVLEALRLLTGAQWCIMGTSSGPKPQRVVGSEVGVRAQESSAFRTFQSGSLVQQDLCYAVVTAVHGGRRSLRLLGSYVTQGRPERVKGAARASQCRGPRVAAFSDLIVAVAA